MAPRSSATALALALGQLLGCSEDGSGTDTGPGGGGTDPDPPSELTPEALELLQSLRYDEGAPPNDPSNRVADDESARALGQRLFFDASLSGPLLEGDHDGGGGTLGLKGEPGKVSCASCHVAESQFVDTRSPHRQISLGTLWTKRRTPTLLEIAFAPLYNWDGRRDSIWGQALGVMESEREFNSGRLFVAQQVLASYRADYEEIFGTAPDLADADQYPQLTPEQTGCTELTSSSGVSYECRGRPGDGGPYDGLSADQQRTVTEVAVNAAKAIAAYVRQLRCGPGRFDAWLDGDDSALSSSEVRGAALFVGKGRCVGCHSGPNLTDGEFHNVGLRPGVVAVAFTDTGDDGAQTGLAELLLDPLNTQGEFSDGDRGVLPESVAPEMAGAFRTPTLRCIAEQPSFLHTGQLTSLTSVLSFFSRGGDGPGGYPGENELTRLDLSEAERDDLVAFLGALMGPGPNAALLSAPMAD